MSEKRILIIDKSTKLLDIADYGEILSTEKSNKINFPVNIYKIKWENLKLYLNEFVYKLNVHYFKENLFDKQVMASITGL